MINTQNMTNPTIVSLVKMEYAYLKPQSKSKKRTLKHHLLRFCRSTNDLTSKVAALFSIEWNPALFVVCTAWRQANLCKNHTTFVKILNFDKLCHL